LKRKKVGMHMVGFEWTGRLDPEEKQCQCFKQFGSEGFRLKTQNALATRISRKFTGETPDMTVKKKIKYLTFYFCCVRKEWMMHKQ